MKSLSRLAILFAAMMAAFSPVGRVNAAEPHAPSSHLNDKMLIEPSTTGVFLSKATLTIAPLQHHQGVYSGHYDMIVAPLSVASEKGDLSVTFTDDAIYRLDRKQQVSFHGEAINSSGKHRAIDGRAVPTGPNNGDLVLKILSERGKLVFHTTYHFAAN